MGIWRANFKADVVFFTLAAYWSVSELIVTTIFSDSYLVRFLDAPIELPEGL